MGFKEAATKLLYGPAQKAEAKMIAVATEAAKKAAAAEAKAADQAALAKAADQIQSSLTASGVPQDQAQTQALRLANARVQSGEPELRGALRPSNEPVRGETSKELRRAQRKQLTDPQKETLETLSQQYPNFGRSSAFMTPQEIGKVIANPEGVKEMNRLLEILPRASELASVAKAGEAKKGWYRASTQALMDVFGADAPRFASLLAAMSPQTSVEMNLLNALNTWKNWTAAADPRMRRRSTRSWAAACWATRVRILCWMHGKTTPTVR